MLRISYPAHIMKNMQFILLSVYLSNVLQEGLSSKEQIWPLMTKLEFLAQEKSWIKAEHEHHKHQDDWHILI